MCRHGGLEKIPKSLTFLFRIFPYTDGNLQADSHGEDAGVCRSRIFSGGCVFEIFSVSGFTAGKECLHRPMTGI